MHSSDSTGNNRNPSGNAALPDLLRACLVPLGLALVSALVYANSLSNGIVHDDAFFIPVSNFDPGGFGPLFSQGLWHHTGLNMGLYRPVLLAHLRIEDMLFGGSIWAHHFGNVASHVVATLLVYGLTRTILRRRAEQTEPRDSTSTDRWAALGTLVFAIHPIHTEAVNSMFNRSSVLATIGVVGALWLVLASRRHRVAAWTGAGLLYLGAMLAREEALVLPALVVFLLAVLPRATGLRGRVKEVLPAFSLVIPLAAYLALRRSALGSGWLSFKKPGPTFLDSTPLAQPTALPALEFTMGLAVVLAIVLIALWVGKSSTAGRRGIYAAATLALPAGLLALYLITPDNPVASLGRSMEKADMPSLGKSKEFRLGKMVVSTTTVLRELVYPYPLEASHSRGKIDALNLRATFLALMVTALLVERKRGGAALLIGIGFILIAVTPGSRLFHALITERSIYLASVGLTLTIALGLASLQRPWVRASLAALVVAWCVLFAPLTWLRNAEWKSNLTLFEAEYSRGARGPDSLRLYSLALLRAGKRERLVEICDENVSNRKRRSWKSEKPFLQHCSIAYQQSNRLPQALLAARDAATGSPDPAVHANVARLLLRMNRRQEARENFEEAIRRAEKPAQELYWRGHMYGLLYPQDREALRIAESDLLESLSLDPGNEQTLHMLSIVRGHLSATP